MILMSKLRKLRGELGETIAAAFLTLQGYEVRRRNLRLGSHEIDLVVSRERLLVFVEVRFRSTRRAGGAIHAVDWRKQREVLAGTVPLLAELRRRGWRVRYDVVAVQLERGGGLRVHHFPGAFSPPSSFLG
jgi:putative endonuclease